LQRPLHFDAGRPPLPGSRQGAPGPLPRRLVDNSPAAQADSWRSKAAPVTGPPPVISRPPPRPTTVLRNPSATASQPPPPPPMQFQGLDLTIKPDEEIEVVDFSDMERLVSPDANKPPAPLVVPPEPTIRSRRPIASDFFNNVVDSKPPPPSKTDEPFWRRTVPRAAESSPPVDELHTQTVPIFSTEELIAPKPALSQSGSEQKGPSSPTASPSRSPHGLATVNATRSPRVAAQFREAPMSTLTDTMSRIKGALVGMQSHEQSGAPAGQAISQEARPSQAPTVKPTTEAVRTHREARPESQRPPAAKGVPLVAPQPIQWVLSVVSRPPPPPSPPPVWKTFHVRIPKVSSPRDVLSKRQQHLWSLPHPGVRWDILSWDPPVEGMSKRELSRDEIFHRRVNIKGAKLRVHLPAKRLESARIPQSNERESLSVNRQQGVVTAAGVKVKLPSVSPAVRPIGPSLPPSQRPSSDVPLWRKSAIPRTPQKDTTKAAPVASTNGRLETTTRSPPPDPLTPTPVLPSVKNEVATPERSAMVSLPGSESKLTPARSTFSDPLFRTSPGNKDTSPSGSRLTVSNRNQDYLKNSN